MKKIVLAIVVSGVIAASPPPKSAPASGTAYPVGISFIREMAFIPEVDTWERCLPGQFPADSMAADSAWDSVHTWVRKQYSPATVRALSNWAKTQMVSYKRTPKIKDLSFTPIRKNEERNMLVFEAVADSLPVHAPIVTRYLKVYLLFDRGERKILDVTVTIRGQVLE